MAIVGEAINGEETVKLAEQLQPDVILMDLHMPPVSGLESRAHSAQQSAYSHCRAHHVDQDENVFAAVKAGRGGYLLKGAKDEILRAYPRRLSRRSDS